MALPVRWGSDSVGSVSGGLQPRWRARLVTYPVIAVLAVAVLCTVEAWPVTSFRLFSQVRTDTSTGYELVAIDGGGQRSIVQSKISGPAATTAHQYLDLRSMAVPDQQARVRAWLHLAGIDPDEVDRVLLERVEQRRDPDGGPPHLIARTVVVEVPL